MAREHGNACGAAAWGGSRVRRRVDDKAARAVLLVVLVAGVLVGLAAAPADADVSDQRALAERYAPVMMLVRQDNACGPGEPYQPSDVDRVMDNSTVALRGPWTRRDLIEVGPSAQELSEGLPGYALDLPGNPLEAGCTYEKWARDVWEGSQPTIYAHVAKQEGRPHRIALQYFFYYAFNDFNNKHESDWERIAIEFAAPDARSALNQDPDLVAYGQHYGAESASWGDDKLEIVDGTHPVVYVSAGSHASQYSSALFLGRSAAQGFGCDSTVGPHRQVHPNVQTIPFDSTAAVQQFPWIGYEGHWGEVGPRRFYEAPTGPNMKAAWTQPFSWSGKARDRSFAVPGGETYEESATGFFCTAVEMGSDVLRSFTARPLPSLVILAVVLLAVTWLVRRTSWRSSSPLPALGRRRIGEIIAVAWGLFWSRPGLFVCIGLPVVATSLAASFAQTWVSNSAPAVLGWSALLLAAAVAAAFVLLAQAATVQALAELGAGHGVRARDAYRLAFPRLLPLAGTAILMAGALLLFTISVLLIPVALVLLVGWSLLIPVVQLDRRAGFRALRRSWRLVRHQALTVTALVLFAGVLGNLVGGTLATVVILAVQAPFAVVNLLPGVVTALLLPFVSLLFAYAYFNGLALEQAKRTPLPPEDLGTEAVTSRG
jgi:hypothetical protein